MFVLSAAEMQACDRATSARFGIPSIDLMRAAASAVASFAQQRFPRARRITVLCGKGNNGGDGLMAAIILGSTGSTVTVVLAAAPEELKGDAAEAWEILSTSEAVAQVRIVILRTPSDLAALKSSSNPLVDADLILDALLGTGFTPPMRGLAVDLLAWLRESAPETPILAIDLPSGWPADETSATLSSPVFPADAVITFTAPKPAHVFGQLTRHPNQPIVVAPIGSPEEAIVSALDLHWAGASAVLTHAPRAAAANKGSFGHVLVVGGTFGTAGGKAGAPAMAALAALRAGAGLVTAAVPAPALLAVSAHAPELMTWPLGATPEGAISQENLAPDRLAAYTAGKTVLALGPGLGQSPETANFVLGLLAATNLPAVLDADALNILASNPDQLTAFCASGARTLVLTPHPGEMARLAGTSVAAVQANRLETARAFARRHQVTLVLKGARTLIAHPDGRVAVNTTGNPGMAKGGSGDLLTGLIAGLLAQFSSDPARAVEAAVYLHGLSADLAVRAADEHTLLATDTLVFLSQAFRFYSRRANGYVWIQGLPPDAAPCEDRS